MSWPRDTTNPFADRSDPPPPYSENPAANEYDEHDDKEKKPILGAAATKRKRSVAGTVCSLVFVFLIYRWLSLLYLSSDFLPAYKIRCLQLNKSL